MPLRGESIGTAFIRIIGDGEGLRDGINEDLDGLDDDFDKAGSRHAKNYKKGFKKEIDEDVHFFRRISSRFENLSEPLGRLLGRGSRNNFLNFFGSVVTNSLLATGKVVDFFETVFDGFKSIGKATSAFFGEFFKQGEEAVGVLERFSLALAAAGAEGGLSTLVTGGLNLVAGIVALGLAFAVAAVSAGSLISALLLLSGIVIALASTISFALIAAVAALAPLLLPLAGIIGGVVAAVSELKNKSSELHAELDKLKTRAKALFSVFKDHAFKDADKPIGRLLKAMDKLKPLLGAAGDGFRRFVNQVSKGLASDGLDHFVNVFERFLPDAMGQLGTIISNVFGGFGGLLRAAVPLARDLLDSLVRVTDNFNQFTNSHKGQQQIREFLDKAKDSAKSLGDFLSAAASVLGQLLNAGKGAGDSVFDSMANGLRRVSEFFKANPDALKNFFKDSEHFAHTLGHAIEQIAEAIDRIDSPTSRKAANWLIEFLSANVTAISRFIHAFEVIGTSVASVFTGIVTVVTEAMRLVFRAGVFAADGIIDAIAKIPGPVGDSARKMQGSFDAFAESVNAKFDGIELQAHGLEVQLGNFNPHMDVDTSAAVNKLNFLGTLAQQIQNAITNAGAHSAAQSGNNTSGGPTSGGSQDPVDRNALRSAGRVVNANIVVNTPTTDPTAVANELLNRLVVVGY